MNNYIRILKTINHLKFKEKLWWKMEHFWNLDFSIYQFIFQTFVQHKTVISTMVVNHKQMKQPWWDKLSWIIQNKYQIFKIINTRITECAFFILYKSIENKMHYQFTWNWHNWLQSMIYAISVGNRDGWATSPKIE